AVVLWIAVGRELPRRETQLATVAVGEYTSPTDVLLQPYGVDVYAAVPSVGCSDSTLGCPGTQAVDEPTSLRESSRKLACFGCRPSRWLQSARGRVPSSRRTPR